MSAQRSDRGKPARGRNRKAKAGAAARAPSKGTGNKSGRRPRKTRRHKPPDRRTPQQPTRDKAPRAGAKSQPPRDAGGRHEADSDDELRPLGIGSRVVPPPSMSRSPSDRAPDSARPTSQPSSEPEDVEAQIRALEARLDGMIRRAQSFDEDEPPPSIREQVGSAAREMVDRLSAPLPVVGAGAENAGVVDTVRELLSSDYYARQWGRLGMRNRSEEVDDFGLDPTYERKLRPLFEFLYKRYFRTETDGIEHVPVQGRCLVVANHSGTLPLDGLMLRTAMRLEHPAARELRWLAEDFVYYLPFVGAFINRIGAVRACQENAERLLKQNKLVAVFPEGVKGIGKLYRERYRLQRFGRGGYIRLCLRTQTPLVPCGIVGAEETAPLMYRVEYLSKALGLPYIPVTPTFPWLGPLGLIPAPTKWHMVFGEPLDFSEFGPEAADDHVLVGRLSERVRAEIQQLLDDALRERQSVWFG